MDVRLSQLSDRVKSDLAIGLLYRAADVVKNFADLMSGSVGQSFGKTVDQSKVSRILPVLKSLTDLFEEGPDKDWWHDYLLLTGKHMVCTEEGWIQATDNTREVMGKDPMEVLDEVNAPE